jgi:hypothetical protein
MRTAWSLIEMNRPPLFHLVRCLIITGILLSAPLPAQIERQHDAHVHGAAEGNLVVEESQMRLELEIPGVNLVGFEHAPRNDDQRKRLGDTLSLLERGDWLLTDPRGQCALKSVDAHTHGFGKFKQDGEAGSGHDSHDDHQDGHGSDHAQHEHNHEHAEFHLVAVLQCQTPERLRWVDLALFDDFPGNEAIRLDVLTEQFVTRLRLHSGSERIDLRAP